MVVDVDLVHDVVKLKLAAQLFDPPSPTRFLPIPMSRAD